MNAKGNLLIINNYLIKKIELNFNFSNSPFEHAITVSPVDSNMQKKTKNRIVNNESNKNIVLPMLKTLSTNSSASQEDLRHLNNLTSTCPPATPFAIKLIQNGSRRLISSVYILNLKKKYLFI